MPWSTGDWYQHSHVKLLICRKSCYSHYTLTIINSIQICMQRLCQLLKSKVNLPDHHLSLQSTSQGTYILLESILHANYCGASYVILSIIKWEYMIFYKYISLQQVQTNTNYSGVGRMCAHYTVNSTTQNANFTHQVAYMCETAANLPWDSNTNAWNYDYQ